jgi:hypothetical protein
MDREYVGIDLHRRRSVIYRMNAAGEKLDCVRIDNEPMRFAEEVAHAPVGSEVVIEVTYGWYWAADLLQDLGYVVHLARSRAACCIPTT